ncbi:MAG: CotH kinase family protein, partial [Eubacteriales bacterium]|nr:CotH kinase family protein [Eubacteriales bacterium]
MKAYLIQIKQGTQKPLFLSIALLCAALFLVFLSCSHNDQEQEETRDPPSYEGFRIASYSCDYSRGKLTGKTYQPLYAGVPSSYVRASAHLGYKFVGWSDGYMSPTRRGDIIYDDTETEALFDYDFMGLPVIAVDTLNGRAIDSRDYYIQTTFSVYGAASDEHNIANIPGRIRGRGNATWNIMDKKSYRLQFDESINLLGIDTGNAKSWVLLANHCDQSMFRNRMGFELGNRFEGIECSSSNAFVDLYVNGRYNGVYLLCEQVEVQKNRVNIKQTTEIDSGYFIELDRYYEGAENVDHFWVYGLPYSIKSDTKSPEQVRYLIDYFKAVEDAIMSGDRSAFEALVDVRSCVDMYILQEFMKNIDVGWSSFFMYIKEDGGKLYYGPPWDFDIAAGNDNRLDNGSA